MTTNIQESNWAKDMSLGYDARVDSDAHPAQVQAEIHRTRERLSSHIDKIQERLQPENLKTQAQDAIQNAMVDSMESVKDYIDDYVQHVNWNEIRDGLLDTIRKNPLPAALVGVGLGWMFLNGSRSQSRNGNHLRRRSDNQPYGDDAQYYAQGLGWREETPQMESPDYSAVQHAKHNAQSMQSQRRNVTDSIIGNGEESMTENVTNQIKDVASQLQEKVGQVSENAGEWIEQWQQSGDSTAQWSKDRINEISQHTQQSLNENPMLFGAVALAVGAGLGMMLPASRYEDELVGDLRQQAIEKAQIAVDEIKERTTTVLNELQPDMEEVVAHVAQNVNEMSKQAVGEVRQSLQKASEKLDDATANKSSASAQSPQSVSR